MKSKAQQIFIMGDVHADWPNLNDFINKRIRRNAKMRALAQEYDLEAIILQCGDFGYWPHYRPDDFYGDGIDYANPPGPYKNYAVKNWEIDFLKDQMVKIYWADGNHENHDRLDLLEQQAKGRKFIPVSPQVFFATFGSVLTLLDGTNVMFCGGAKSDDQKFRKLGDSWWEQEEVDEKDLMNLPDHATTHIDWVISHNCPKLIDIEHGLHRYSPHFFDPSRIYLDEVMRKFQPKRWFFGHYHRYCSGENNGCEWMCLDYPSHSGKWWESMLITEDGTSRNNEKDFEND